MSIGRNDLRWRAPSIVGLLIVCVVLTLLVPGALGAQHGATSSQAVTQASLTDPLIDHRNCTLLGRQWDQDVVDAHGRAVAPACSRVACLHAGDYAKKDIHQETCVVGGRRGRAYGVPIDVRRCQALHRRWIGAVNYCISLPDRSREAVPHAPQCKGQWSTYLELDETEGYYDQCVTPEGAAVLRQLAQKEGITLAHSLAEHSRVLCSYRARTAFVDGFCRHQSGPLPAAERGGVVLVGDSVSWLSSNELGRLKPTWDIDAIPGRNVQDLPTRIARFHKAHGDPQGLIVALGTNPSPDWTQADYRNVLSSVSPGGHVMFVTPYRRPGSRSPSVHATVRYSHFMHEIADRHTDTCIADWRGLVTRYPFLLSDGVHPTPMGQHIYAVFIARQWQDCLDGTPPAA